MVCQTERPEETRVEPCCQFEMQIYSNFISKRFVSIMSVAFCFLMAG